MVLSLTYIQNNCCYGSGLQLVTDSQSFVFSKVLIWRTQSAGQSSTQSQNDIHMPNSNRPVSVFLLQPACQWSMTSFWSLKQKVKKQFYVCCYNHIMSGSSLLENYILQLSCHDVADRHNNLHADPDLHDAIRKVEQENKTKQKNNGGVYDTCCLVLEA